MAAIFAGMEDRPRWDALLLLTAAAAWIRFAAAGIADGGRPARAALGAATSGLAAWLWTSAWGAWAPLWVGIVTGLAAGVTTSFIRGRYALHAAGAAAALASGWASLPSLPILLLVPAMAGFVWLGWIMDELYARSARGVRTAVYFAPAALSLAAAILHPGETKTLTRFLAVSGRHLYAVALASYAPGEKITLDSGAAAWWKRPRRTHNAKSALLFHGAHSGGARQPAAFVLRQILMSAGYAVLSVDHPGYGASPLPFPRAEAEDWNPAPTALAAHAFLEREGARPVLAMGHSMGCSDALRLAAAGRPLEAVVLFGAGRQDAEREDYWRRRFRTDRRMSEDISLETFRKVRAFYDAYAHARALPPDHPPVLFVEFGREHADVAAGRLAVFEAIPGCKARARLEETGHYFDAVSVGPLVLGRFGSTRRAAVLLNTYVAASEAGSWKSTL
ncbi:MAG: alpha/beta fold hydrolase [Elusimicrobiota bacterium]